MQELLAFIVDRINVGVFVVDRDMRLVLWNRFMEVHSGLSADSLIGQELFEAFPELPEPWLRKKIETVFIVKNFAFTSWEQRPYLFRFPHNRPVTGGVDHMQQDCTFLPLKDGGGDVRYVCVSLIDVTDTAVYQQHMRTALAGMEEMSVRDSLSGLFNRRYLEQTLDAEVGRVKRYGGDMSILLLDIDHFKQVNDRFGHQIGDSVIRDVAGKISGLIRQSDVGGRYGGEEFTVILPNTGAEGAVQFAERLRQRIAAGPVRCEDVRVDVTVSIGVATVGRHTQNYEQLVHEADLALYRAKAAGRDRVCRYEDAPVL